VIIQVIVQVIVQVQRFFRYAECRACAECRGSAEVVQSRYQHGAAEVLRQRTEQDEVPRC